MRLYVVLHTIT